MFAALAAARFAHFAAISLLFGVAAFPFYAPPGAEPPSRFSSALRGFAVLALLTAAVELVAMAGNMGGSLDSMFDREVLLSAATDTQFGRVWLGRLALSVVVVALSLQRRPAGSRSLLAASGLLLASVALTGHSGLPGGWLGKVHQLADAAHLLAAGWWIGGLLALALAARTLGDQAAAVLARFSGIGYVAVGTILATGLLKSAVLLGSTSALLNTAYGWVLLLKIVLFGCMGLLALSNRFQITPALERGRDPAQPTRRLRTQVTVEFCLGVAVLAVVGALGAMPPPIAQ